MKTTSRILSVLLLLSVLLTGCSVSSMETESTTTTATVSTASEIQTTTEAVTSTTTTSTTMFDDPDVEHTSKYASASDIASNGSDASVKVLKRTALPEYAGKPYVVINNNEPGFTSSEKDNRSAFENYSDLDSLGRCGTAFANICREIMPTEKRGAIGMIKPSGWHTVKYDNVDGKYLYNRCHLIGYQLSAENANVKNLITGTRYLNIHGMLPFENMVADYVKETGNHVAYRVTPVFVNDELVARGVQIEAYSVEDDGDGICFNVYCFNVQPDITIDYATGASQLTSSITTTAKPTTRATTKATTKTTARTTTKAEDYGGESNSQTVYITATGSKYHRDGCQYLRKSQIPISLSDAKARGYTPCSKCF